MNEQEVEALLDEWKSGSGDAFDKLATILYSQMKAIANKHMSRERRNHTLQPTALVNEAFLRLKASSISPDDLAHLKNIVGVTMRRILVDHARRRNREKRGGNITIVTLLDESDASLSDALDVLAIDEALLELATFDSTSSEIVCGYYFGGMTYSEISIALKIAESTVHKKLRTARAWIKTRSEQ